MQDHAERLARTAQGWDEAADGYEAYFVPRFAPWLAAAVAAVTGSTVPEGPVLVPCCGTFPELDTLVEAFPDRDVVGIDLSAGMVRRARERAVRWPRASVVHRDASTLDPAWTGRCAVVVSVFGLQQLPEPAPALRSWVTALRPAGRLSVVYWPGTTELDGPFALLREVLSAHVPPADSSWESDLVPALTTECAVVERDEQLTFSMSHPDAPTFFDAYTRSGPLRALADARGDEFVDQVRAEFLRHAPRGGWSHRPGARLVVARR